MENHVRKLIGVIGASSPSDQGMAYAEAVGREIARAGAVVVCGGLGGVMEAVAKGASGAGGDVIGILPGPDKSLANPYVTLPVATNMGHARNIVIAHTSDVLIAIEGGYGTISEAAIGLKLGKTVIAVPGGAELPGIIQCACAEDAVALALDRT